jgi:hypothetical protein
MFITPQIVTVKGSKDQEGSRNTAKINHDGGKSEEGATEKCRMGYSDALKAGERKFRREADTTSLMCLQDL